MSTPLNGSILKAFCILRLITRERPDITAKIVASELGMTHATAHRLLLTLEEAGAVAAYRRGFFSLGPVIEELGVVANASNQIAARISPLIEELALDLNESAMVCRLGRHGPACIAVAASTRSISVNISVGTVLPMTTSAQGKLWLAAMEPTQRAQWLQDDETSESLGLEQIRACGYARNRGENEPDIGALSVPIQSASSEMALTLSTFGMIHRFDDQMVARNLPVLLAMAKRIKAVLPREK